MSMDFAIATNDKLAKKFTVTDIIEASKRLSKIWLEKGLPMSNDSSNDRETPGVVPNRRKSKGK